MIDRELGPSPPLAPSTMTLRGTSAAVSTATTPGSARGRRGVDGGDPRATACSAATTLPCSMPGQRASRRRSAARPRPCPRSRGAPGAARRPGAPSLARPRATATVMAADPPPRPPRRTPRPRRGSWCSRCSGTGCRPAPCGSPPGSAAGRARSRPSAVSSMPGVQKPHWAAAVAQEALLQRVRASPPGDQAAHGGDRAAVGLHREHQAGVDRLAVEQHRAGPAHPLAAAVLDLGWPSIVAEHVEQAVVRAHPGLALARR